MSRETQPAVPTGQPLPGRRRPLRTSLLSPAELAATLEAGAEPCGVVQGTAAMWSPSDEARLLPPDLVAAAGYVVEPWSIAGFRPGMLVEDPVAESAWNQGFDEALRRLVADAGELGAHGVVGIRHWRRPVGSARVVEHALMGTAVVVPDAPPPPFVWTTHLVGPKLSSLVRSGWMPVSWVTAMGALQHRHSSYATALQAGRGRRSASHLVDEVGAAAENAVWLALASLDEVLGGERLVSDWERWWSTRMTVASMVPVDFHAYAIVGTRLRRFRDPDPSALDAIVPTVDLR